jgi:predicted ATPase/class 3 adenylate cyclase
MIRAAVRRDLPSGTVTFLFTDVEGSTRLLHELGAEAYADALAEHRRVIREACVADGGVEVDTQGDAFFFAFPSAPGAVAAAAAMTASLASGPIQVRIGLHTGTPLLADEGYVGDDVHFAARVASAGHGGQVILSAATAALLEPSDTVSQGLTDLGEHRLKDIEQAVPIFQLGDDSFPPLKTISNTNLPRPASSFVGRDSELSEVLARIQAGARLVTLTGPGGTGKTRLAIEAASTLVPEYNAGVFWVGLASLRDPALVTETIALVLGAKDGLAEHIGERELLLLLDNLEQVVECAPELSALLQSCPNLTLLVTSRELLRVQGEVEHPVPPLASFEAVSLFCERAQLQPTEEIAELCARLDSLPLAVELAAARTKALTPAQILERLSQRLDLLKGARDADPRQQTLRATIEWSYDLLSEPEQELFARLSVFAGGCTLEAAEEVADADLDTLQSLVEKSLLRFSDSRYWMLETIREFASERLEASETFARLQDRHADWFAALAMNLFRAVRNYEPEAVLTVDAELDNLRAALAYAFVVENADLASRVLQGLWFRWLARGRATEAASAATRWLELDRSTLTPESRILGLAAASEIVRSIKSDDRQRDWQAAVAMKQEMLLELRASPELVLAGRTAQALVAALLADLTYLMIEQGDLEAAAEFAEEAVSARRALGDPWGIAHALLAKASVATESGDPGAARELYLEALAVAPGHPEAPGINAAIAETEMVLGRLDDAARRLVANIDGLLGLEDRVMVVELARIAALLALRMGKAPESALLLAASERLGNEIGWSDPTPSAIRTNEAAAAEIRSILGAEDRASIALEAVDVDENAIVDLVRSTLEPWGAESTPGQQASS